MYNEDQLERRFLINQVLEEESDFNFPKIYLLSHYADQIFQYSSLPQYSTGSCETSHTLFKNAYCWTNHVDAIPQIIQGYMWEYSFAMKELNIEAWANLEPSIKERLKSVLSRKRNSGTILKVHSEEVYMQLQGKRSNVTKINRVVEEYQIPNLYKHMHVFLRNNTYSKSAAPESDVENLMNAGEVEAFNSVEIPVLEQDTSEQNAYILYHLRHTGKRAWRGQEVWHDVGWIRLAHNKIQGMLGRMESFSGRVPEQVNAMFILCGQNRELYRLAHISLLQVIRNTMPKGPEGMRYMQWRENGTGDIVV